MNDVFKANISYNKSKSKSSVHNETVEKSSLVSGRNMNIKSKNGSITISGIDVKVENDLDLNAKKDINNDKVENEKVSELSKKLLDLINEIEDLKNKKNNIEIQEIKKEIEG